MRGPADQTQLSLIARRGLLGGATVSEWQDDMRNLEGRQAGVHRLSGWQAIATYFQRNPSTVRRWAAEHGLPIHRPAGAGARKGAAVFAYPDELDDWLRRFTLQGGGQQPVSEARSSSAAGAAPISPRGRLPWKWTGLAAAAFGIALAGPLFWSLSEGQWRPAADGSATRLHGSTEANRELFSNASYLVEKRTPESLSQAVTLLEQLTRNDPGDSLAWSELATAFNLMVEYGQTDAETGYGKSRAAAERALALNPALARAQTVLADMDFFWLRATGTGLARFEQALALDPSDAQTLHWYATALAFSGEPSRALIEIRKAKYADPGSRAIRVSEAIILLSAGQGAAAGAVLEGLIRHEPAYRNPYRFLAFVKLGSGDYGGYLDAWSRRFELTEDQAGARVIAAGRDGLRGGGAEAMIAGMGAAMAAEATQGALEPYFLAHLRALSADMGGAIAALEKIETRHAFYYSIDPAFAVLRQQAAFQEALRSMKMPAI